MTDVALRYDATKSQSQITKLLFKTHMYVSCCPNMQQHNFARLCSCAWTE